ncbi:atypical/PIKK/FRAP protein kinase [Auriculariales sp. MPI-PUGE-AT-0066]|nr:atypical/PIKK/FRAP protein kinase [Auriculariales sp. MPI-PUGE-AT-0066]
MAADTVARIWEDLCSEDQQRKQQAALRLTRYVESIQDQPADAANHAWDENVSQPILLLLRSKSEVQELAGLFAIEHIITIRSGTVDIHRELFKWWNAARDLVNEGSDRLVIAMARAVGQIVGAGAEAFGNEFIVQEIPALIALLNSESKTDQTRLAGVLVLTEIAKGMRHDLDSSLEDILLNVFTPLTDPRITVRDGAAKLLAVCLLVAQRHPEADALFERVLHDIETGLRNPAPESVHGSLLAVRSMFFRCPDFMSERYMAVADLVLRYHTHKDASVRRAAITLVADFAACDAETFKQHLIYRCMSALLDHLARNSERDAAFATVGHVAIAVGQEINHFLPQIMPQIWFALHPRTRGATPHLESAAFDCLTMLADATRSELVNYLTSDKLDLIFSTGLSEPLINSMFRIASRVPSLHSSIQERLLDMLSKKLIGLSFRVLGSEAKRSADDQSTMERQVRVNHRDPSSVRIALEAASQFPFRDLALTEFVRDAIIPYMDDDEADVRLGAAQAACVLLQTDPIVFQVANHTTEIINDSLSKVLSLAISDQGSDVRGSALKMLREPKFERILSQPEHLPGIFMAVNDANFDNRIIGIDLVGKACKHNPALIMPWLRKILLQLTSSLQFTDNARIREEAIYTLTELCVATKPLLESYALSLLHVLLPKASDPNPTVATMSLSCIGELSAVGRRQFLDHVPQLMTTIIALLNDPSAQDNRETTLKALADICFNTGYVIEPIVDHPKLMPTLNRILDTHNEQPAVKEEVIRVIGVIGAIDPYRRASRSVEDDPLELNVVKPSSIQTAIPIGGSANEDYYQRVVMSTLLKVLSDPTAITSHRFVVECIMVIFKTHGQRVVVFLPQVIPSFITVIEKTSIARFQEFHVQQLAVLIELVAQHIRNYATELSAMIKALWPTHHLRLALVKLIEAVAQALDTEFRPFLPSIVPLMLDVFDEEQSSRSEAAQIHILKAIVYIGNNIEDYLHLVVPAICKPLNSSEAQPPVKAAAANAIHGLARRIDLMQYSARLVLCLVANLEIQDFFLQRSIMDALSMFVVQLGENFCFFAPGVSKMMAKHRVDHEMYSKLIATLERGDRIIPPPELFETSGHQNQDINRPGAPRNVANNQELRTAWKIPRKFAEQSNQWSHWYTGAAVACIRQAPSSALRSCVPLLDQQVTVSRDIARELFPVAFLCVWVEAPEATQEEITQAISEAINDPSLPADIGMSILNLAEFMEHQDYSIRLSGPVLRDAATRFRAYAKALHWTELEFHSAPASSEVLHQLVSINTLLRQDDAAFGIVDAVEQFGRTEKIEWQERLGRWEIALQGYKTAANDSPEVEFDATLGMMRCYQALGEWEEIANLCYHVWDRAEPYEKSEIAPFAASAAWAIDNLDGAAEFIDAMECGHSRSFLSAMVCTRRGLLQQAREHVKEGRTYVDGLLYGLTGDDYVRNYSLIYRAQMFAEIEEIIQYKLDKDSPQRQADIRETWKKRLLGCQEDVDVWQRAVQLRAIVLEPAEAVDVVVKFANLCRKSQRPAMAQKALDSIVVPEELRRIPLVDYSRIKLDWAMGMRELAMERLGDFQRYLEGQLRIKDHQRPMLLTIDECYEYTKILARCALKHSEWTVALDDKWIQNEEHSVLSSLRYATQLDPRWFKAWHTWALYNNDVINAHNITKRTGADQLVQAETLAPYAAAAIQGLFQSIILCKSSPLQDVLRVLTLWFRFGASPAVDEKMDDGFQIVPVDTWIDVIPQIIARIQTPSRVIRDNIMRLLDSTHFPLTVACSSSSMARKRMGKQTLERMRAYSDDSATIVMQAEQVSQELIRVAILWQERWHDALEEASRLYFTEKNPEGMLNQLEPLHRLVEGGGSTTREMSFVQAFGADLGKAAQYCARYRAQGDMHDLERAWEMYYPVFKKLDKQVLPQLLQLDLQHVSPRLLAFNDLVLAGTYHPSKPLLRIHSFTPRLGIISSKQRPRRMSLRGIDGREYEYLLKGHEDLRQDERVMQFLGLVNTHLASDHDSYKRLLHMQRYPIVPLAPNAGLIGWCQDTDTFHVLVRDYREARSILLNIENRLMVQMASDYKTLTLLQKVEVFKHAMDNTTGQDLFHVMWLRSTNSESWLERRTTYTRSLAVSSMVGYVLGLGDRHPSNILIHRVSGKIIHIDFGDCFEIAMRRDEFPEKVPFRLTRMLIHAMEPSGIRGSYLNTTRISMKVLRDNSDSLLAVLEAFIYDPLISWRLLKVNETEPTGVDEVLVEGMTNYNPLPNGPAKKPRANEQDIFNDEEEERTKQIVRQGKALTVYNRVRDKLKGSDFSSDKPLGVEDQVSKLVQQAINPEALCQHFPGWCACW